MRTVTVGLALLNRQGDEPAMRLHLMMSNSMLFILPPVVIFFIFQRYFIRLGSELSGLTTK